MRVLFVSPFPSWPLSGGAPVRIHHLLKAVAREHEVWFVSRDGGRPPGVDCHPVAGPPGRYRQLFDLPFLARAARLIRSRQLEVAIFSSIITGLHLPLLKLLTGIVTVFDDHNAEHVLYRRLASPLWPVVAVLERLLCATADGVSCVSPVDAKQLNPWSRSQLQVVANGAEVDRLALPDPSLRTRLGLPEAERLILFFGVMNYQPNAEAVELLLEEVLPRLGPHQTVLLAGEGSQRFQANRLRGLGFVPDIATLIRSCDVIAVPLKSGSGTRLKILEAVAQQRPVVSTSVGAEGLVRERLGAYLRVEDDWDRFVAALVEPTPTTPPPDAFRAYDWGHVLAGYLDRFELRPR